MAIAEAVAKKVLGGERLSREEGVALLRDADLLELGMLADAVRQRLHPEGIVTYIIDRNINYTNVCVARCSFCAFYREPGDPEGYLHDRETLFAKVEETLALGGTGILSAPPALAFHPAAAMPAGARGADASEISDLHG